jgi:hypothetical protein
MEYAKLQGAFLRSARFKDAEMPARGAWVTLIGHCADQTNGGRIVGCRGWNDRQWLSRTDCLREDVDLVVRAELAAWDGHDLVLEGYDRIAEGTFRALSEVNRKRAMDQHAGKRSAGGNDASGTGDASRRHGDHVPPAVRPAPADAAAGTDFGCQPPNQPTNQPPNERGAGAPPPPMGVAAPGSRDDATTNRTPRDLVGESFEARIRRGRAAEELLRDIEDAGALALLAKAPREVQHAHAHLADRDQRVKALVQLELVRQWWSQAREGAAQ